MADEMIFIDEEFLQRAVAEQAAQDQAALVVSPEELNFNEVVKLSLEYNNIRMISHLWDFTSLARLDLNNNLIEKIEGLDHLINLTWLNLSFNRIEKIEGLDSLRKLEVLNLTHNRISAIENMDALENLTHFIIGKNLLGQLDNVLYLKRFKELFAITLSGNPVSQENDYRLYIAACFPDLAVLDYRLIDMETRHEASIKYEHVTEKMKCEELERQLADEAKQRQEAEVKLHTDAFVEFLNGSYLFQSMLKDDPEMLHLVPEVAELLQPFEHQMVALCKQLFETGLAEHERREMEMNSFFRGQNEAIRDYQQKASHILTHFEQQHKERIVELQQLSDPELLEVKINHCKDEIKQVHNSFMDLEFQLFSQQEDIINKLDINISEMVGSFIETALGIFVQCRDLEDKYHGKVQVVAENMIKDDVDEDDMQDDIKTMFRDKEKVMDMLATCHHEHLMKINDRETQMVTRVDAWKVALIKGIQDKERRRNREQLSDMRRYVDYLMEQLEHFQ